MRSPLSLYRSLSSPSTYHLLSGVIGRLAGGSSAPQSDLMSASLWRLDLLVGLLVGLGWCLPCLRWPTAGSLPGVAPHLGCGSRVRRRLQVSTGAGLRSMSGAVVVGGGSHCRSDWRRSTRLGSSVAVAYNPYLPWVHTPMLSQWLPASMPAQMLGSGAPRGGGGRCVVTVDDAGWLFLSTFDNWMKALPGSSRPAVVA